MKNILSSLNESEKKRILEMHYKASNRHYLMEATNADYNVIKTSVDATYKETLNKFLMAGVSLIDPDDKGKPTKIQFDPLDPNQSYSAVNQLMGTPVERKIGNPTYKCGGTVQSNMVDETGKPSVTYWDDHLNAQEIYSRSIGAEGNQPRAAARTSLTTELGKVAAAACKAIDAVAKGLPNPLAPKISASNTTQKQQTPATKGAGGTISQELLSPEPKSIITPTELSGVGLGSNDGPRMGATMVNKTDGGFIYGPGDSIFYCYSSNGRPAYTFSYTDTKLESAFAAYKPQITALWKKQCAQNAKWANAAVYRTQKVN